jgi:hypothetical protein
LTNREGYRKKYISIKIKDKGYGNYTAHKNLVEKDWFLVDAEDKILSRLQAK